MHVIVQTNCVTLRPNNASGYWTITGYELIGPRTLTLVLSSVSQIVRCMIKLKYNRYTLQSKILTRFHL